MGVEHYDEKVVTQMLEFMNRYVINVLTDAQVYSKHAEKPNLDVGDVRLAVKSRMNTSFTHPPPRELLLEDVERVNRQPMPTPERWGVTLPPREYCLLKPNTQLQGKNNSTVQQRKSKKSSSK
eukprot:CAMPEP_0201549588 /NCGR_PEP_ID=MMETSP0173_2-20130828/6048_1 /ASSEMBLY_ACC=CAM_ASM_000268 /TAXON_ID=218659 /ORGANISM="Vexillifera sp., Strain DIVA3 564/2" /LENGTH=122 /DNA_ID=CAMNT_0047959303 /DNA_START=102 /DNA_END=470 /DNA_ORIENTATION=-